MQNLVSRRKTFKKSKRIPEIPNIWLGVYVIHRPADLSSEIFGSVAGVFRRVFTSHVACGKEASTQLMWVLRPVGRIIDHPLHIIQHLRIWEEWCTFKPLNYMVLMFWRAVVCVLNLLPSLTAWQICTHMEYTIQAVDELSTPPLRGRRKPAWKHQNTQTSLAKHLLYRHIHCQKDKY